METGFGKAPLHSHRDGGVGREKQSREEEVPFTGRTDEEPVGTHFGLPVLAPLELLVFFLLFLVALVGFEVRTAILLGAGIPLVRSSRLDDRDVLCEEVTERVEVSDATRLEDHDPMGGCKSVNGVGDK